MTLEREMYNYIWILIIPMQIVIGVKIGPTGLEPHEQTTCEEFSRFARFNPFSVLGVTWFVFYYWAPYPLTTMYRFAIPTANETDYLHLYLDDYVTVPVNWTAKLLLMKDRLNRASLLVERNDRGHYWYYPVYGNLKKGYKLPPIDIRIKQTADNKYLGMLTCEKNNEVAIVMSRLREVPPQKKLQDEAAKIGYRASRGRSYLYQGHHWMPVPEANEYDYWAHPSRRRRYVFE